MKHILLVRHAKSSWEFSELEDSKRPLNHRGLRDAPYMASFCRMQGLIPDVIISSPAVRAYTTAEFFQKEFSAEVKRFEKESDLYFGSESDWMHLINELDEEVVMPVFFSHNPTITYFSNSFTQKPIDNVPTCGVVYLKSKAEKWSTLHYDNTYVEDCYFPKQIRS